MLYPLNWLVLYILNVEYMNVLLYLTM